MDSTSSSDDFCFKHRHESTFDRILNEGAKKTKPKNKSEGSSKYVSALSSFGGSPISSDVSENSSHLANAPLFLSITEDVKEEPVKPVVKAKKQSSAKSKKASTKSMTKLSDQRRPSTNQDPFSDSTLNAGPVKTKPSIELPSANIFDSPQPPTALNVTPSTPNDNVHSKIMITSTPMVFSSPNKNELQVPVSPFVAVLDNPNPNKRVAFKSAKKWRRTAALAKKDLEPLKLEPKMSIGARRRTVLLNGTGFRSRPSIMPLTNFNEDGNISIICEEALSTTDKVLSRCTKQEVIPFNQLFIDDILEQVKKIGEGSFGEVFIFPEAFSLQGFDFSCKGCPVLKLVPVDGTVEVNGDAQTMLEDMLAEIVVSSELSSLVSRACNYVQLLGCFLVQGLYPSLLLKHWDDYDTEKGSENDRPDGSLLPEDQRFIALLYGNGGKDLEAKELKNASESVSILFQVAHALAVAEEDLEFEHRDLHWGNILVQATDQSLFKYNLGNDVFEVKSNGVVATIIDFSLSRMVSKRDRCEVFSDLSKDTALFESEGDYQFDIYRMMKDEVGDDWKGFYPKTNVMWLHYLIDKFLTEVPYTNKKSKKHKSCLAELRSLKSAMLDYSSAKEFVQAKGLLSSNE